MNYRASKPLFVRSIIFISLFYSLTAIACILCVPILLIPDNNVIKATVVFYDKAVRFIERYVLGISYEVRGEIPKGCVIIAAKHFSAYETLKLHLLLDSPAIVLKKELLQIPIWGWFLARAGAIPINRSKGTRAIAQIDDAARNVAQEKRPIVIFPQGTRVNLFHDIKDKPYHSGVSRLQSATGADIVPLATNSGVFWPRDNWKKRGGVVIFEFLEPIKKGLNRKELISALSSRLEGASNALVRQALMS